MEHDSEIASNIESSDIQSNTPPASTTDSLLAKDTQDHSNKQRLVSSLPSIRKFDDYTISASLRSDVINPETAELYSSLPSTGFGTVSVPSGYADQVYPACGLFLLGFFCLIPWVFGAFYLKSRNTTARTAGILSLILAITTALVVIIVLLTGR